MANDRRKKKRRFRSTGQFIGLLLLAGLFALNALVALASLSQRKYSVSVGSAAPETIRATREIEDVGATETRKQARALRWRPFLRLMRSWQIRSFPA